MNTILKYFYPSFSRYDAAPQQYAKQRAARTVRSFGGLVYGKSYLRVQNTPILAHDASFPAKSITLSKF